MKLLRAALSSHVLKKKILFLQSFIHTKVCMRGLFCYKRMHLWRTLRWLPFDKAIDFCDVAARMIKCRICVCIDLPIVSSQMQ